MMKLRRRNEANRRERNENSEVKENEEKMKRRNRNVIEEIGEEEKKAETVSPLRLKEEEALNSEENRREDALKMKCEERNYPQSVREAWIKREKIYLLSIEEKIQAWKKWLKRSGQSVEEIWEICIWEMKRKCEKRESEECLWRNISEKLKKREKAWNQKRKCEEGLSLKVWGRREFLPVSTSENIENEISWAWRMKINCYEGEIK